MIVYKQLPTFIKDKLIEAIEENFTKYDPKFYYEHECSKCGKVNELYMNVSQRFFRMVLKLGVN